MMTIQLIQTVVEWERRLEYENERRAKGTVGAPAGTPRDPQPCPDERESIQAAPYRSSGKRQTVSPCS